MKLKIIGLAVLAMLILLNFWAIYTGIFWLENCTYILFFLSAVVLGLQKFSSFSIPMYLFFGFTVLSYLVRFFNGDYYSFQISLVILSAANTILIIEAAKYTFIKNGSNFVLLFFFLILGINGSMLGSHVYEIKEYTSSNIEFLIYSLYYLHLLIFLGLTSLVYYLNSYSRRFLLFISLVLGIIFADVLRDMELFYQPELSVDIAESIIRLSCAIFAVYFFNTREKQLRLSSILK